jgi:hypothetical protein
MKQDIARFLEEGKELLKNATPQQKLRFLKLMKESMHVLAKQKKQQRVQLSENADYLEEK